MHWYPLEMVALGTVTPWMIYTRSVPFYLCSSHIISDEWKMMCNEKRKNAKFLEMMQMAEVSYWCLSEDPMNRPEVREVVESLARIVMSSVEWEASLGGSSQVFSGVFDGR